MLSLFLALCATTPAFEALPEDGSAGIQAYREGAYARASAHWRQLVDEPLADEDRARLLYNLGNAAWRQGEPLQAVAWYTSSLRVGPRSEDTWANLEFARSELGLEPFDRGDLRSTLRRLVSSLRPPEARNLLLGALVLWGICLLFEATRGGRFWRAACLAALALVFVAAVPRLYQLATASERPAMIVASPAADVRSEPRAELAAIDRLSPAVEVEWIDSVPGWVRIETGEGVRGWVPEASVFELEPWRATGS